MKFCSLLWFVLACLIVAVGGSWLLAGAFLSGAVSFFVMSLDDDDEDEEDDKKVAPTVVERGRMGDADFYRYSDGTIMLRRRTRDGRWAYLHFTAVEGAILSEGVTAHEEKK